MNTKTKRNRTKQNRLPGMEIPTNKKIEKATEVYVEARDERMVLRKREVEARTILLDAMKKAGVTSYEFDGCTVTVLAQEKVKVSRNDGDDDLDEDAEELVTQTADGLKG